MDWVDWHFVAGLWAGAASVGLGCLLLLGGLRALRRNEPRGKWVRRCNHNYHEAPLYYDPKCPDCNPQPTSPPSY